MGERVQTIPRASINKTFFKSGRPLMGGVDALIDVISEGDAVPRELNAPLRSIISTIQAEYNAKFAELDSRLMAMSDTKKIDGKIETLHALFDHRMLELENQFKELTTLTSQMADMSVYSESGHYSANSSPTSTPPRRR